MLGRRNSAWIHSPVVSLAAVALAGLTIGVTSRLGDGVPPGVRPVFNLGGVWLVCAFWAGARARSVSRGALAGTILLVAAVLGYYGYMHVVEGQANRAYLRSFAVLWAGVALVGGPLFGGAGAEWRYGRGYARAVSVALMSAALAGEGAFWLFVRAAGVHSLAYVGELAVAGAAIPTLLRRPRDMLVAIAVGGCLALGALGALGALVLVLRAAT